MSTSTKLGRFGVTRFLRAIASRRLHLAAALAAPLLAAPAARAGVVTWSNPAGGSWNLAGNWNPETVPNAVGDGAVFNNAASANNPTQTGNRAVTADGAQTVGSIVFNN